MAFADTLKITPRDVAGPFYAGKTLRGTDVVSIDPHIKRIIFRQKIDIRALNFASSTEVVFMLAAKIGHVMGAGRIIAMHNLFCGSIEAGHDIIVNGDLSTWIGGIESQTGHICVTGGLVSAAHVRAEQGCIVIHDQIEYQTDLSAAHVWCRALNHVATDEVRAAATSAGSHIRKYMHTS